MSTTLTESEICQCLAEQAKKYAPLFPEVHSFSIAAYPDGVSCHGAGDAPEYKFYTAYAPTIKEAADKLRATLGTPETKAAALRKQANELLAQAKKLKSAKAQ